MTKKYNQKLGRWGEELAAQFLISKGCTLIEQNYRVAGGEIDLICQQGEELVFVEVKTRTNKNFGYGEESVSPAKQRKILVAINSYLQKLSQEIQPRFDVIVIEIPGPKPKIIHYENVELEEF